MKALLSLIVLAVTVSCASAPASREVRSFSIVEKSDLPEKEIYLKAIKYFSGALGNLKASMMHQDNENHTFVLKTNVICNELRQLGDPADYRLHATVSFEVKPGRYRISYEDLEMTENSGKPVAWAYLQLDSSDKITQVKPCLSTVTNGLKQVITLKETW